MTTLEPEREVWFDEQPDILDDGVPEHELMETAHAPAANAPDWLNAMVPGLDVDFGAKEDEQVEQEYISGQARRKHAEQLGEQNSFDWVTQLVDAEINQPAARRKQAFTFSRQPVWLRQPTEQRDPALQTSDDDPFAELDDFDPFDDDSF